MPTTSTTTTSTPSTTTTSVTYTTTTTAPSITTTIASTTKGTLILQIHTDISHSIMLSSATPSQETEDNGNLTQLTQNNLHTLPTGIQKRFKKHTWQNYNSKSSKLVYHTLCSLLFLRIIKQF